MVSSSMLNMPVVQTRCSMPACVLAASLRLLQWPTVWLRPTAARIETAVQLLTNDNRRKSFGVYISKQPTHHQSIPFAMPVRTLGFPWARRCVGIQSRIPVGQVMDWTGFWTHLWNFLLAGGTMPYLTKPLFLLFCLVVTGECRRLGHRVRRWTETVETAKHGPETAKHGP